MNKKVVKAQYKSGAIMSYLSVVLNTLINFFLTPYIVGEVGDDLYGMYTAIASFSVYLGIMDLGLGSTVIKYVSDKIALKDKRGEEEAIYVIGSIYKILTILVIAISICISFFVPQMFKSSIPQGYNNQARLIFLLSGLNIAITIFFNMYYSIIRAYEQFMVSKTIVVIQDVLQSILIVAILFREKNVVVIIVSICVSNLLAGISKYIYCKKILKIKKQKYFPTKEYMKGILSFSVYVLIYSICSKLFWQIDKVLLGIMSTGASVTIYAIGTIFTTGLSSISSAISSMYLPHAVRNTTRYSDKEKLLYTMVRLGKYQLYIILLIVFGFFFWGKQVIGFLYKGNHDESYYIALMIMVSMIIPLCYSYSDAILKALNKQKFTAVMWIVTIFFNIIFTVMGIKILGAVGAAIATVITYVLQTISMSIYLHKIIQIDMIKFYLMLLNKTCWIIIPSIIIGSISIYIGGTTKVEVLFQIVIFVICYLLEVYIFLLSKEEKDKLRKRLEKKDGKRR